MVIDSKIDFVQTGQFSKLFSDYITSQKALFPFYSHQPNIQSFQKAIQEKSSEKTNRELLVSVLNGQYSKLDNTRLSKLKIQSLSDSKTFTVCTGHQLCLFTGPLYFIYKILSTINLAEALKKKYPENNFVPIYWMASEDHDFEEISTIHLFGKTLKWNNPSAKGPVGSLNTDSLNSLLTELKPILGDSANAKELFELFQSAYINNSNLADATRFLVHHLFGEFGLVILDGNDSELKSSFSEYMKDDILNQTNFKIVNKTIFELESLGYKSQVNPREVNVFDMKEGDRIRMEANSLDASTVDTELSTNPSRFSPNVVLRPLYQQVILPNLAYVGGPSEIAYWLEYKAMFDHHKIAFPVLIPRSFVILNDDKTKQQIQSLGFMASDFFKSIDVLNKEFLTKHAGIGVSLAIEQQKMQAVFIEISEKAAKLDPTLKASVVAEMQKALASIKNIESKLLKSEKQKQEISISQIKKIKAKFFPEGDLQERYENFSPFYIKLGKQFIADLKQTINPLDFQLLIVTI